MTKYWVGIVCGSLALWTASADATESGFYVGMNAGQSDFELDPRFTRTYVLQGGSKDDTDTAWSLVTGYRFNRFIGVEVGYLHLGEATGEVNISSLSTRYIYEGEVTGPMAAAVVAIPIKNFEFNVKAGAIEADVEFTYTGIGFLSGTSSDDESPLEFFYAVGAAYTFSDHYVARLDWTKFPSLSNSKATPLESASALTAGFAYRF